MNEIIQGDALQKLRELPEKSINMCMTSPPYWALRDYGTDVETIWENDKFQKDWRCEHKFESYKQKQHSGRGDSQGYMDYGLRDNVPDKIIEIGGFCIKCNAWKGQLGLEPTFDLYIKHLCDIFDEVKRVLRKDGTCWVNIGDTYYGNSSYSNSGRAGFSGKDGNNDEWKRQFGNGKCLYCGKLCKTQFCDRTCLNKMGNDFRSQNRQMPSKSLVMIPFRFAIEMVNRGWILRNTIIWHKPNAMPSSVKDRFSVDFEYLFFFSKSKKYYFETQYEKSLTGKSEPFNYRVRDVKRGYIKSGQYKASKKEVEQYHGGNIIYFDKRNKRTVWTINPKPFKEAHFAVYPEELCETPIKAGCSVGGIVLDPFFGAGTTGLVALKQNKKFIGIELNKKYIEIAKKRLKPYLEQTKL